MSEFVIFTDSSCDIKPEVLKEWGVYSKPLHMHFEGESTLYMDNELSSDEFYTKMRAGAVAKTSAVNSEEFIEGFEPLLKDGKDVLYMGISSGISTTFNSARLAALELNEKYQNKVIVIDTLAASAGVGLIVYLALKKKAEGATIEETAAYIESIKNNVSIWLTVDDLVYLKRGGRVSPTAAFLGNLLGVKPIIHMDEAGKLIPVIKVRGRKLAIDTLAKKYEELATDLKDNTLFISHADCEADARKLEAILAEKYGAKVEVITGIGSVIGAHAGPGTIAFFFIGKEK